MSASSERDVEAEQALLGAILVTNSILAALPFLEALHFAEPLHQRIFAAIRAESEAGRAATPLTLKHRFDTDESLADIGGGKYLAQLAGAAIHALFPVDIAKGIVGLAQRRALEAAIAEAQAALQADPDSSASDVTLGLLARFEDISRGFDGPVVEDDVAVTERILKGMFTRYAPNNTGIARLDTAMDGGLYPGKAYGFAAKKKFGKTILAGTISANLNEAGVKHLFICGEMSPEEIHQRTLARLTDSFPSAFRGDYGASQAFQRKVADVTARSKGCTLYHNAPGLTFDKLRRVVLSSIFQRKINGFILDYWQLVGGKTSKQNTSEHLDNVAQWIADTCRKHNVWAVVMAQINQEGNTRGSEGIRLAFDQVYQIHRPDLSTPQTWLEMMDTRYTRWLNVGNETQPGLLLREKGPWFENAA